MTIRLRERRVHAQLTIQAKLNQDEPATAICFLQNLSLNGACLSFPDGAPVPEQFDLFLEQGGGGYRVKTMWKQANTVGVRFIELLPAGAQPHFESRYGMRLKDGASPTPRTQPQPTRSAARSAG